MIMFPLLGQFDYPQLDPVLFRLGPIAVRGTDWPTSLASHSATCCCCG